MPNQVIVEEIKKYGAIPFARFMELALYCPDSGYYEKKKDIVGRDGDFITSVSVGSLFGELLAWRLAEWLMELQLQLPAGTPVCLVEAGAHDGRLAADILGWLERERPRLFQTLEYLLLEPSAQRRSWQAETLRRFAPRVAWHAGDLAGLHGRINGVILSNELLDAFPIRQFGWDAGQKEWYERGVTQVGHQFVWGRLPDPELPSGLRGLPGALLDILPDGYVAEDSPAAEAWWGQAAGLLARGKLMAIDYGFVGEEMFSPVRQHGSLRAYFHQHYADDVLANPGDQDLTAHVNFSAIQAAGEAAGLKSEPICTQPQFLTRVLAAATAAGERSFLNLDAKRVRQLQSLTHPEHLGRAFRVLVQGR